MGVVVGMYFVVAVVAWQRWRVGADSRIPESFKPMALALTFGWILASRVWMFRDEDFEEATRRLHDRWPSARELEIPVSLVVVVAPFVAFWLMAMSK